MVKSGLIFLTFLSLIFSTSGNIVSDFLDGLVKKLKIKGHLDKIDLGKEVGCISNLDLKSKGYESGVTGLGSFGFNLTLQVSEITITGEYNITYLDIPIPGFFPIVGKGKIDISLKGNAILMEVEAKPFFDEINVKMPVFEISVQESKVLLENLFHDPELSNFLNTIISNLLPKFVIIISDVGHELLEPFLQYFIGEVYNCVSQHFSDLENCLANIRFPDFPLPNDFFFDQKGNFNLTKFVEKLKLKL